MLSKNLPSRVLAVNVDAFKKNCHSPLAILSPKVGGGPSLSNYPKCVWGGGGQGLALIFIPRGGGPPPLPWTPSPPPPSAQVQLKTWVLGTFFGDGEKISRRLRRTPHTVYLSFYVYSAFLVLQITMTQRSLSVYFCSPVQPSPRAKRKDVIDVLLYFRFKDRITGWKRQEAYNEAQKACATLFLSVPMATLV